MIRRPVGVVISAIILGLAAAMLCLMAGASVLGTVMMRFMPSAMAATPGVAPPPQGFMMGIMVFNVLLYLALAAWAISTVAGLIRMRNWARISIMIIGGGLAAAGVFSALLMAAMPTMMKSVPMPPNADPAMLRGVFFMMAILFLLLAAIGVWWLVYFALRNTRMAFTQAAAQREGPPLPSSGRERGYAATRSPMTDFTIARPIAYGPGELPVAPEIYAQPAIVVESRSPARPVSITVIAILMFIGMAITLLMALMPFPAFFFGVTLPGWTGHTVYLVFAGVAGIAGVGLLKLQKPAWVLSLGFYGIGLLNILSMALPSVRQRMIEYQQTLAQTTGMPAPIFDQNLMNFILLSSVVFDVLIFVFLMVLLWRARWAFEVPQSRDDQAST